MPIHLIWGIQPIAKDLYINTVHEEIKWGGVKWAVLGYQFLEQYADEVGCNFLK